MPTIGQSEFFFGGLARGVRAAGFDRAIFFLFGSVRESRAPRFGVRFAAMAAFYVNCGVPVTQASIAA
jgi:hypothetical protein